MEHIEIQNNCTKLDNRILFSYNIDINQKTLLWFFNIVSNYKEKEYWNYKEISKITGLSLSTIKRKLPKLIKLGFIVEKQEPLDNGFYRNVFRLNNISDYNI